LSAKSSQKNSSPSANKLQVQKIRIVSDSGDPLYVALSANDEDPNSLEQLFQNTLNNPINGSLTSVKAEIKYRRPSSF
jgi:hypothetical protein